MSTNNNNNNVNNNNNNNANNNNNNKMKGLLKGLRYISQIFDNEKEPDMQIGFPTDVKHVAHIGWDGPSVTSSPSWMTEFKAAPGGSSDASNGNGDANDETKWVSEDSASRRVSRRASDCSSRDLPELPKSRRHSSTGGAGDSPTKEKTEKKQSRRSSRNAHKELGDGKSSRQKDSSQGAGDSLSNNPSTDAPKKARRKKSKDGSASKSSRSKAQASNGECGSESGSVSESLNVDTGDTAPLNALNEDAENGLNDIS